MPPFMRIQPINLANKPIYTDNVGISGSLLQLSHEYPVLYGLCCPEPLFAEPVIHHYHPKQSV